MVDDAAALLGRESCVAATLAEVRVPIVKDPAALLGGEAGGAAAVCQVDDGVAVGVGHVVAQNPTISVREVDHDGRGQHVGRHRPVARGLLGPGG